MAQENYREFICSYIGPGCDFKVRAKTEEEVMRHAEMHISEEHGMEEIPSDVERKIKESIKQVKID